MPQLTETCYTVLQMIVVLWLAAAVVAPPAPITPGLLSGKYSAGDQMISFVVAGTDPQPGSLRAVTATQLKHSGACWRKMTGTVSNDGRTVDLNASCVSAVGNVSGKPPGLSIEWTCKSAPDTDNTAIPLCRWPVWRPDNEPPSPPPTPGPPGSWPVACTADKTGLESCWPTCQVRCPATARCCRTPYAADKEGVGCCDDAANPNREPGCKAGPPQPLASDRPNVIVIGDSVSMGYTPWVQKHLGSGFLVQHAPWGDGSAICNTTTDPPCDPDPTSKYTGDGGDEETAYGVRCLNYFIHHPNGQPLAGTTSNPLVIMFNWGLHDGPLGNATHPGQQGNSSVYAAQLREIATRLHAFCIGAGECKLLFALTSAMICNVKANDNVAQLNAAARRIMASFSISTVDLQTAIVDKCAPLKDGVRQLPVKSCFNSSGCFCPHCPNSLARPSPGYEWLAENTIVPAIRTLLNASN